MSKKHSKQQVYKLFKKTCFFCGEDNYAVLDAHRILPGSEGGTYHWQNMLTLCATCHRKVHAGDIVVERKYQSSTGRSVVHYFVKGEEFWKSE